VLSDRHLWLQTVIFCANAAAGPSHVAKPRESTVKELKNFAEGLKKDGSGVYEATRQAWSNGPVEGHVNRLKTIKRQMYGRASFDLLRLRVLLMD